MSTSPSYSSYEAAYLFAPSESEAKDMEDIPSYEEAVRHKGSRHIFSSKRFAKGSSISLELNSTANDPDATPHFSEGATLAGRVLLDFKKKLGAKEVTITVRGRATSLISSLHPTQFDTSFLDMTNVLWSSSYDVNSSSPSSSSSPLCPPPVLPFQLSLPTSLSYKGKDTVLPPTYAGKAYIDYVVEVTVKRDFLHSDLSLQAPLRYLPRSRSQPFQLLSLGRAHRSPGPGDPVDPSVWHESIFSIPVRPKGGKVETVLLARVLIPLPLVYSTGSSVPFYIFLSSAPSPDITSSTLSSQNLEIYFAQHCAFSSRPTPSKSAGNHNTPDAAPSDCVEVLAKAKLSRISVDAGEASVAENTIALKGTVDIPRHAVPTFDFPLLSVEYRIHLVPKLSDLQLLHHPPLEVPISVVVN
ncbi:hypothetical protein DL93DRAFT_924291 [Clavulina sp. PMI_390]|nr:hypothetical protein DL93DRAFT_924291 [Clavulina sp. PMI_390]